MHRMASLRWIMAVVGLVAVAMTSSWALVVVRSTPAGGTAPVVDVGEAVRRTVAEGSARLVATLTPDRGGAGDGPSLVVELSGVTSLVSPAASVVATAAGRSAEVRVTEAGAWVRVGPEGAWTAVDPAAVRVAASAEGWADLLGGLRPVAGGEPPDGGTSLRATHQGDPVTLQTDGRGRITRLTLERPGGVLDVRFHDFGAAVDVEVPPPP